MKAMNRSKVLLTLFVLLLGCAFASQPVLGADDYPNKTIRIEAPWGAGSNSDALVLMLAPYLEKVVGQRVVPVYKKGGGGIIGTAWAAKQPPDGYTLLIDAPGPIVAKPLAKKVPYSYKDFVPIAQFAVMRTVLVVKEDSPFKNFKDLLEAAKKRPGEITFASSGAYSMAHFTLEIIKSATGAQLKHVPYEGGAKVMAALLGGHVDVCGTEVRGSIGRDGKTRVIATSAAKRIKKFPEVETITENGYDVVTDVWYTIFAPKDTPKEIVKYLESAIKKVCENKEYQEKLEKWGPDLEFMPSEETFEKIDKQYKQFKKVVEGLK